MISRKSVGKFNVLIGAAITAGIWVIILRFAALFRHWMDQIVPKFPISGSLWLLFETSLFWILVPLAAVVIGLFPLKSNSSVKHDVIVTMLFVTIFIYLLVVYLAISKFIGATSWGLNME